MAKMIPEIMIERGARGERKLYKALQENLPDEFTVFHSLPFLSIEEGRGIYEHEIDFLVVHRELGFLDVEVKGGSEIRYMQKQKKWISVSRDGKEHTLKKDPFRQASDNIHWLTREIMKRGILDASVDEFPFSHGFSVAFPDASVDTKYFPPQLRRELILDSSGMIKNGHLRTIR